MTALTHLNHSRRSLARISARGGTFLVALALCLVVTTWRGPVNASAGARPGNRAQAAARTLGVTMGADGTLHFTRPRADRLPLGHVHRLTVAGSHRPDGSCEFRGQLPAAATAGGWYAEEVARNVRTCATTYVVGTLTQAALRQLSGASASPPTMASAPAGRAAGSALAGVSPATSYALGYTKTQWIDPVNITITSQVMNFKWPLYGAGGTLSASWPSYTFPYDGWSGGTTFSGFNTLSDNSGWWVRADGHFVNYDFAALVFFLLGLSGWLACGAPSSTRADFYHHPKVTGYRSGSRSSTWTNSVSGACSNLVHVSAWGGSGWASA
ncbi:MAG: hypothetical protein R2731_17845 [Nocardioides sp.]